MAQLSTFVNHVKRRLNPPDRFLNDVAGVVHIGANVGQERDLYAKHDLPVIWVEPIPTVFDILQKNLDRFPKQIAYKRLITETDGTKCTFHISNNDGLSSSILELAAHRDIWPQIEFTDSLELDGASLPSFFRQESIDPKLFDALVLDTQGSELLILQGAAPILSNFRYIKSEVADFESYAGCCTLNSLTTFLLLHGFRCVSRNEFARSPKGGKYYDIVYKSSPRPQ